MQSSPKEIQREEEVREIEKHEIISYLYLSNFIDYVMNMEEIQESCVVDSYLFLKRRLNLDYDELIDFDFYKLDETGLLCGNCYENVCIEGSEMCIDCIESF